MGDNNTTPTTLAIMLTARQNRVVDLVKTTEALIAEAADLRDADRQIVGEFNLAKFTPWEEAVRVTFETLVELIKVNLQPLRAATELSRHDAPLAVREHGALLREIRRLTIKIDGLRHDRPSGPSRVSQAMTIIGSRGPSNVASEIIALLLPPEGDEAMAAATSDVLSRLSLGEAGVPFEVLHGADGGQPPVWEAPAIVRLLAEPVEATA